VPRDVLMLAGVVVGDEDLPVGVGAPHPASPPGGG
jgi:hypothetical protein